MKYTLQHMGRVLHAKNFEWHLYIREENVPLFVMTFRMVFYARTRDRKTKAAECDEGTKKETKSL